MLILSFSLSYLYISDSNKRVLNVTYKILISYRSSCQDCFTLVSARRPAGYSPAVLYKAGSTLNYFTEFWFYLPLR